MSSAIETQLTRMLEAARREGIEPGTPLGDWVEAVRALTGEFEKGLAGVIADARAAAQASAIAAEAATRRAEAAARNAEFRTEQVLAEMVEQLTPAVAEALGSAIVIRERRHNRAVNARWAMGIAIIALLLFGGGWIARGKAERDAIEMRDRCLRALVQDSSGRLYCSADVIYPPPSTTNTGRR